jgi:hypothetical protein
MQSIPFSIPNVYEGFAETEGLIRFEKDVLILEYQTKDSIVGVLKSGLKEVRIPLSELDSINFEKKLFKTQLTVRARKMSTFADIPANKQGEATLRFIRKNRDAAEELASNLALRISEYKLQQLDHEMNEREQ